MDILHLIRSQPDDVTERLISEISQTGGVNAIKLYETDIDWEGVVDAIFKHRRVVCWW